MSGSFVPLVDFAVKTTLVVALSLAAARLMRRSSASGRHVVLLAGMLALIALPVMEFALPRWQVPIWVQRVDLAAPAGVQAIDPARSIGIWTVAWTAGALALAVRWLLGLREILKARRTSVLPSEDLRARVENLLAQASSRCQVQLVLGGSDLSPMTWGWWRPVLALPSGAEGWPEERLRAVILHEMAHIERGDWLSHELARVGCVLYWFHPGVWLVARAMERESEHAADDRVLSLGCSPEDYAEHLVDVARSVRVARNHLAVAMARRSPIGDRLQAVLAMGRNRTPMAPGAKSGLFFGCAALAAVMAAAGPTVLVDRPTVVQITRLGGEPALSVSASPVELTADNFPIEKSSSTSSDLPSWQDDSSNRSTVPCPDDKTSERNRTRGDDSGKRSDSTVPPRADDMADQTPAASSKPSEAPTDVTVDVPDPKQMDKVSVALKEASKQLAKAEQEMKTKLTAVNVAGVDRHLPEIKVDTPDIKVDTENFHFEVPGVHVRVPSIHIHVPPVRVDVPSVNNDGPSD